MKRLQVLRRVLRDTGANKIWTGFLVQFFISAAAIWLLEPGMPRYGDALWWALNVCSVGDACYHPVTNGGRVVGALLIVIGYGCFAVNVGIVTAVVGRLVRRAERGLR